MLGVKVKFARKNGHYTYFSWVLEYSDRTMTVMVHCKKKKLLNDLSTLTVWWGGQSEWEGCDWLTGNPRSFASLQLSSCSWSRSTYCTSTASTGQRPPVVALAATCRPLVVATCHPATCHPASGWWATPCSESRATCMPWRARTASTHRCLAPSCGGRWVFTHTGSDVTTMHGLGLNTSLAIWQYNDFFPPRGHSRYCMRKIISWTSESTFHNVP